MIGSRQRKASRTPRGASIALTAAFLTISTPYGAFLAPAVAQTYSFSNVTVEGNDRVDAAQIVKFAGIAPGQEIGAGALNDAFQRVSDSGLFESVELVPSGNTLIIRVVEYPTINVIAFEGNRRIDDDQLSEIISSEPRRVFSPAQAEQDAAAIAAVYAERGRFAARVEPRVIRRDGNRVDLVFEIREGRVSEIERLSFTGNRSFSDYRLRQVLETKQAGLLRQFIQRDTYLPDRIDLDRQVLSDFYLSRGFIDVQVTGVSSEIARERDAFFVTFNIEEGPRYRIGNVTTVSEYPGIDTAMYAEQVRVRSGRWYSPNDINNTVLRLEGVASQNGAQFLRVEPRFTRNPAEGTVDVAFVLVKGPRIFVERIDIEGNVTTQDQVIRRQFRTVEGDPLNPREIRESAERIRALGFFSSAEVVANPGTSEDQVIVDVNVEEQPTGTLSFGASYGVSQGFGLALGLSESNFLGRGQFVALDISTLEDSRASSLRFIEPALLGRDLAFKLDIGYTTSDQNDEDFDTRVFTFIPAIEFPLSERSRLELRYSFTSEEMSDYTGTSTLVAAETALGRLTTSGVGYTYTYDTRIAGLNPNATLRFRFGQDISGLGGDVEALRTTFLMTAQTRVWNEEVTLRAEFEGGALNNFSDNSRVIDRFSGNGKIRGFQPNGYGPRDTTASSDDPLGGNYFTAIRFEAEFPLGLPEEYGITGGLFADFGSLWGLDNAPPGVDDGFNLRSTIGISIFWTTPIGPLRFNFAQVLQQESYDEDQSFDLTISTQF